MRQGSSPRTSLLCLVPEGRTKSGDLVPTSLQLYTSLSLVPPSSGLKGCPPSIPCVAIRTLWSISWERRAVPAEIRTSAKSQFSEQLRPQPVWSRILNWPLRMQPQTPPCVLMHPGSLQVGKAWGRGIKGHVGKHQRGSDPAPTSHAEEWCRLCLELSSVPAQGPSRVQVVTGGPDEKDRKEPTSTRALLPTLMEEIHPGAGGASRCRTPRQPEGPWGEDRASEDGHQNHGMGTHRL